MSGLTIENGNVAGSGGGILNHGALALNNVTVAGNTATVAGGGIENQGTLTPTSSNVSANTGGDIDNAVGATVIAGDANAFTSSTNIHNNGTLNLFGFSNSMGALTGSGTITNNAQYQDDNGVAAASFNNSLFGTENEDSWVGNVFTGVAGETQLQSVSLFYPTFDTTDLSTLGLNITAALYTGSPSTGLTLIPGSVNTVPLTGASPEWITVPFATPQNITVGEVFTAALLVPNFPPTHFLFGIDDNDSQTVSYYDVDNPPGATGTYNLASPNFPTLNGQNWSNSGSNNSAPFQGVTMLRVNSTATAAATLTVTGGGFYTGNIQDGSGTVALTVAGAGQTLTLSGNDTFSGATTINNGDTLKAGSTTALSAASNVSDSGTLNMGGFSGSIGALTGGGAVTNNLVTYQIDNGTLGFGFNNTIGSETSGNQAEDSWVGNVFTAAAGGTQLQSTSFFFGAQLNADLSGLPDQHVTAALYTGCPRAPP